MKPKEKAIELVNRFSNVEIMFESQTGSIKYDEMGNAAKQCALIAVQNEYNSLRELLFNLMSCKVIESEKTYLIRLDELINEEKEIKQEIENI